MQVNMILYESLPELVLLEAEKEFAWGYRRFMSIPLKSKSVMSIFLKYFNHG